MAVDFSDPVFIARMTAVLSTVMLVAVQAGLGCTVTIGDLRNTMRKPLAVALGLLAQVIFMPAIAYGLASALGMKGDALLGLSLVACTPGGSMSNVFSYFSRGVLAPDSRVPFTEIIKTLALTIGPTAAGIALKTWRPRIALWGEKLGAGIGGIAVIGAIVAGVAGNWKQLPFLPAELFISTALLGVLGMFAAYLLAIIGRIKGSRRITLIIETGVQNLALTLALIALAFDNQFSIVVYSYIFGFVICFECLLFTVFVRWSVVRVPLCGVDPSELELPLPVPTVSKMASSEQDSLSSSGVAEPLPPVKEASVSVEVLREDTDGDKKGAGEGAPASAPAPKARGGVSRFFGRGKKPAVVARV
ncbi:sodium bile acid symporter family-domain-containing protein [Pavlovales sp. CCMP2436]|nr:sodium bile acid symporter family-domain-containing protein [Pavlovales sp. CCMP2436]